MTLRLTQAQAEQLRLPGMEPGGRTKRKDVYVPLEWQDQARLVQFAELHNIPFIVSISDFNAFAGHRWLKPYPDLKAKMERDVYASLKRLKQKGWRRGKADWFTPRARQGYHGLFLELKRLKNGKPSADQLAEAELNRSEGYLHLFPSGADEGIGLLAEYMGIAA